VIVEISDFGLRIGDSQTKIRIPKSEIARRVPLKSDSSLPEVQLFTDGACSGNPGPGGWAFILRHPATGKEMERSGGEQLSTNNKMELTAVVEGLGTLKRSSHVEVLTDSVYVGKGMIEWLPKWKANGWRRKEKNKLVPIANEQLWRKLDALLAKHKIKYTRVAGHSGHAENDRVDELAVAAYQQYL
jgi:ribonuclease HI